jgi:hypothetical protein
MTSKSVLVGVLIIAAGAFAYNHYYNQKTFTQPQVVTPRPRFYYKFNVNGISNVPAVTILTIDNNGYPLPQLPTTFIFYYPSLHNYSFAQSVKSNTTNTFYTFKYMSSTCDLLSRSGTFPVSNNASENCTTTAYYVKNITNITKFVETGLPNGGTFKVQYDNITKSVSTTNGVNSIIFNTTTGNYTFISYDSNTVSNGVNTIYYASPSSGRLVAGSTQIITFSKPAVCPNSDNSGTLTFPQVIACAEQAGFTNSQISQIVSVAYQESAFKSSVSGAGIKCINSQVGFEVRGILQEGMSCSGSGPSSTGAFPLADYNPSSCNTYVNTSNSSWSTIYDNPTCAFQWAYAYTQSSYASSCGSEDPYCFWGAYISGTYCKYAPTFYTGWGCTTYNSTGYGENLANFPWGSYVNLVHLSMFKYTFNANGISNTSTSNILTVDGVGYPIQKLPITLTFLFSPQHHSYSFVQGVAPYYVLSHMISTCRLNTTSGNFTATQNCTTTAYYLVAGTSTTTIFPSNTFNLTMSNTANITNATTPPTGHYKYVAGSKIAISAMSVVKRAEGEYMFSNWTGTGAGSYTGTNNATTVTINSNINEVAKYHYVLGTTTISSSTTIATTATTTKSTISTSTTTSIPA